MYQSAIGFSPSSLLSGLSSKKASPFAKGQAMQAASGLAMDREQKNQDFSVKQMQDDTQARQQQSRNYAQRASNESQERMRKDDIDTQGKTFDIGMNYDRAALQKRRWTQLQQTLLNGLARDF